MGRKVKPRGIPTKLSLDNADADQLFTVEQTARILGISEWMMRKQIQRHRLPVVFIEKMTRIRAADIRKYISDRRNNAA